MTYRVRFFAVTACVLASAASAAAANLPAIKASGANKVPACATPGRLMAFAAARNGGIADKFDGVATEYMRHGEALGLRWDYAFFQMMVETANLKFPGDVNAKQNNFAGLGATGGGEPGESFKTVSDGVKAHLQHVLMYTGAPVEEPIAERTRKVQEWGVLTNWQKTISGPMSFTHLTRKWSPTDRGYSKDIASVADSFYSKFCAASDPRPELVAEARGQSGVTVDSGAVIAGKFDKGKEAAKRAIADARASGDSERKGLGAGSIAATEPSATATAGTATIPAAQPATYTLLNSGEPVDGNTTARAAAPADEVKTAAAATSAAKSGAVMSDAVDTASAKANGTCRVWQASYGGEKAVIIKVVAEGQTNYTVLDVNEGREQREVAAYIAAYAQDGNSVGEFASPSKALSKAFELCPEG